MPLLSNLNTRWEQCWIITYICIFDVTSTAFSGIWLSFPTRIAVVVALCSPNPVGEQWTDNEKISHRRTGWTQRRRMSFCLWALQRWVIIQIGLAEFLVFKRRHLLKPMTHTRLVLEKNSINSLWFGGLKFFAEQVRSGKGILVEILKNLERTWNNKDWWLRWVWWWWGWKWKLVKPI